MFLIYNLINASILYKSRDGFIWFGVSMYIYACLDKVLMIGQSQTEVMIVSQEYEKINEAIIQKLDRGTTMLKSITGYMKNEYPVIMIIVSHSDCYLN